MYDIDGHGERTEWRAEQIGQAADLPVAVLVNGYTASAAEIVAGALQDYGVWLIGSTTYGKGSICVLAELSDGSALCVTCARWYTPLDYCVEGTGLSPNEPGGLEKAIEYIKDEIGKGSPGGLTSEEVLLNV
jgi:carboxyl-terminal processing protease